MEIKEMKIGEEGLDATLIIEGKEIKLGQLKDHKELNTAQSYMCAIICEQFFELAKMYADEKGIELNQVFESQEHLDNAFKSYIAEFMEQLVKNAIVHSKANWELFKHQRENPEPKHYDA